MSVYYDPKESPERRLLRGLIFFIIGLLMAFIMALFDSDAKAQEKPPSIPALQVGEKLPDWVWQQPLKVVNDPQGKERLSLSEYKGKLIIIDFWATWCSSCIVAMRDKHPLQEEFKEQFVILPITYESAEIAGKFLRTNKTIPALGIKSVVNDSLFVKLFPHRILPHYVWISPDGTFHSSTAPSELNAANISTLLKGAGKQLKPKVDINMNQPLFLRNELLAGNTLENLSILVRGQYEGASSRAIVHNEAGGQINGFTICNYPLANIYEAVLYQGGYEELTGRAYSDKRRILELSDSYRVTRPKKFSQAFADSNFYNYSLHRRVSSPTELSEVVFNELNHSTGYYGRLEKRLMDCYLLRVADRRLFNKIPSDTSALPAKAGLLKRTFSMPFFASNLEGMNVIDRPVEDVTGFTGTFSILFNYDLDRPALDELLRQYGLELREGKKEILAFVLGDRPGSFYVNFHSLKK